MAHKSRAIARRKRARAIRKDERRRRTGRFGGSAKIPKPVRADTAAEKADIARRQEILKEKQKPETVILKKPTPTLSTGGKSIVELGQTKKIPLSLTEKGKSLAVVQAGQVTKPEKTKFNPAGEIAFFNPFDAENKKDTRTFETAAEYVANAPEMTSLLLGGGALGLATKKIGIKVLSKVRGVRSDIGVPRTAGFLGKDILKKGQTVIGGVAAKQTLTNFAKNTKVAKLTANIIAKAVAIAKKPAFVYTSLAVITTYPFTGFLREEALQAIKGSFTGAAINENVEGMELANQERAEILDPSVWDNIISKVPFANSVFELKKLFDTAKVALTVDNKILEDIKEKIETGTTDADMFAKARAEQKQNEIDLINFFNAERKKMFKFEQQARGDARNATRAEEKKARNDDATFWAREAAKQREIEADERVAIADFWIAYRRTINEINQQSRTSNLNFSNLNFGLL